MSDAKPPTDYQRYVAEKIRKRIRYLGSMCYGQNSTDAIAQVLADNNVCDRDAVIDVISTATAAHELLEQLIDLHCHDRCCADNECDDDWKIANDLKRAIGKARS